jgi:hypothetical protein
MNSSEFIKKAKNQVILLVAFTVALVGTFLPGLTLGEGRSSVSLSMFGYMGLWGILTIVGTVASLGAVGFDAYNVYNGKANEKRAMFAMIIAAGSSVVGLVSSLIWYLTGSSAGSGVSGGLYSISIGLGLMLTFAALGVAAFFSVTSVMKNKDYAKKVLNEVKGDMTKGGEAK